MVRDRPCLPLLMLIKAQGFEVVVKGLFKKYQIRGGRKPARRRTQMYADEAGAAANEVDGAFWTARVKGEWWNW